jgi:hypothetical protein
MAVHVLNTELPEWDDIVKKPETAKLPDSAGARVLLVYTAIQKLDKTSFKSWMTYLKRFQKEAQALFATTILRVNSKGTEVSALKEFVDWAKANSYLFN